jgi:hypothetical protein
MQGDDANEASWSLAFATKTGFVGAIRAKYTRII